ncbi:cytidine diphosphoramidate kinase, partial [Campylobacter jejuni]|nr:cytidine diphosphoramidate kinase [Campylobacter jejuni]
DMHELIQRDQKGLYTKALNKEIDNVVGVDIEFDKPEADLVINNSCRNNLEEKVELIIKKLAL